MADQELPQAFWAILFVAEMARLGVRADAACLADRGFVLWHSRGAEAPEEVAKEEFRSWPAVNH
jgi:hypothetical protein